MLPFERAIEISGTELIPDNCRGSKIIHLFEYLPNQVEITDEETRSDTPVCPHVGTVQSIVVFVKFAGDNEFLDSVSYYGERLNSQISRDIFHLG